MNGQPAASATLITPARGLIFVSVAVALGLTVAYRPFLSLLVIAIPPLLLTAARGGHHGVLVLFLFLTVQEPLQDYLRGVEPLGTIVRYADEVVIPAFAVTMFLRFRAVRGLWLDRGLILPIAFCYLGLFASTFADGLLTYPAAVDLLLFSKPFLLLTIGMGAAGAFDVTARRLLGTTPFLVAILAPGILFFLSPDLHQSYISAVKFTDERLGMLSATSLFSGPGTLGWFACAAFALCVAAFLAYERYKYAAAGLLCAFFCVISWRRKSIIAMAVVVALALAVKTRDKTRRRTAALLLIAGLVAGALLAPFLSGLWSRTVEEYGSDDPTASARSTLYYGSLLIARDLFPLGSGFATYGSHASIVFHSDTYRKYGLEGHLGWGVGDLRYATDTYWPMVLGQGGFFALAALLLLFAILIKRAWRASVAPGLTPDARFVANVAFFLLVASLFESTASHLYGASFHSALVMIPVGMFLAASRKDIPDAA